MCKYSQKTSPDSAQLLQNSFISAILLRSRFKKLKIEGMEDQAFLTQPLKMQLLAYVTG